MSAIQETNNLGDLLKYEAPNLYSRDLATVAAGQNLQLGAIVGRDSTTGKRPLSVCPRPNSVSAISLVRRSISISPLIANDTTV